MTAKPPGASQEAPKRRGRPPASPEDRANPRTVRLDDARWHKLQSLGRAWLERQIDRART